MQNRKTEICKRSETGKISVNFENRFSIFLLLSDFAFPTCDMTVVDSVIRENWIDRLLETLPNVSC